MEEKQNRNMQVSPAGRMHPIVHHVVLHGWNTYTT